MNTRREFLFRAPGLALAVALSPTILASAGVPAPLRLRRIMRSVSLNELSSETFAPLVNSAFTIDLDGWESRHLILADVLEEPRQFNSEGAELETFSLLFWDASPVRFPQRTYRLRHSAIGQFGLFLVPVSRAELGQYYQAVFNRLWQ